MGREHKKECKLLLLLPLEATISELSGYYCILEVSQPYLDPRYAGSMDKLCLNQSTAPHLRAWIEVRKTSMSEAEAFVVSMNAQLRNIMHLQKLTK